MYRLSRDHDKLPALTAGIAAARRDADALSTDWAFYLNRSAQTLVAMGKFGEWTVARSSSIGLQCFCCCHCGMTSAVPYSASSIKM